MLKIGDRLADTEITLVTEDGQDAVGMQAFLAGKKVALFAMPGAFTSTCSGSHLPNIIRNMDGLKAKGIDEAAVLVVNDTFVVREWGKQSGAFSAGITMISDPISEFTKSMGLAFSVPPLGFVNRSQRYAAMLNDGIVEQFLLEESRGQVASSGADHLLEAMG